MNFQPIINVVLVAPEIPHNTGNLIRLCANVGAQLHLVEPLGFRLKDPKLSRASLDYGDITNIVVHSSIDDFFNRLSVDRIYGATIPGNVLYTAPKYQMGDTIIFGSERKGLSQTVVDKLKVGNRVKIPMTPTSRSLNLSNAAAVIVYEMWRQIGFYGSLSSKQIDEKYFS